MYFQEIADKFYEAFIANNYSGLNKLWLGLGNTLIITFAALVIGVVLGILLAIVKVMPVRNFFGKVLLCIVNVYITVVRGTPIVVQLLLIYFGFLSRLWVDALVAAIIVFGLNSAAYVAEIIRSGIQAVDNGQLEAGRSLGLSYAVTMRKIILPQAIKNILPALGNELIVLIKETSVASFITVEDLTKHTSEIASRMYEVFIPYTVLALIYLVLVMIVTFFVNKLERRMKRSDYR